MRGFNRQSSIQKWARFALKFGLLVTDAKLWSSISDQLRDRVDDVGDEMKQRYEDATDRLQDAQSALRGRNRRNQWVTPTVNFLGGVGIGVGLGMLLAPAPGEETRSVLRDKVVDLKNRVSNRVAESTGYRSTGTEGD